MQKPDLTPPFDYARLSNAAEPRTVVYHLDHGGKELIVLPPTDEGEQKAKDIIECLNRVPTYDLARQWLVTADPEGADYWRTVADEDLHGCIAEDIRDFGPDSPPLVVSRGVLKALVGAAETYADDLGTGLEDGTYDQDPGLEQLDQALINAKRKLVRPNL